MAPKFTNPHSLSQDVQITTRSEIDGRAGFTAVAHDENSQSLQRDLDNLLRDAWGDALAETSSMARADKSRNTPEGCETEDTRIGFRLISSMGHPQFISLGPKLSSIPVSRGPDCEDDETQAEMRRMRSLAVAVGPEGLGEAAVLTRAADSKPVEAKVTLANTPFARSLPPLLLIEETRTRKTVRRLKHRTQADASVAVSPHEPRASCTVLAVKSVPNNSQMGGKKRRKPPKERPQSAYWRPPPGLRGKCMGYALGYPSSWAPEPGMR